MCCLQWSLTSMASTPPMTTRMEPRIVEAPPSAAPTAPKTASATVDAPSTTASLRDAWKRVYWNTHITRCRGISGGWTVLLYFRGNAADAIDAAPGVRTVAASARWSESCEFSVLEACCAPRKSTCSTALSRSPHCRIERVPKFAQQHILPKHSRMYAHGMTKMQEAESTELLLSLV